VSTSAERRRRLYETDASSWQSSERCVSARPCRQVRLAGSGRVVVPSPTQLSSLCARDQSLSVMHGQWEPCQPPGVTALLPVSNYTAWFRGTCVNQLSEVTANLKKFVNNFQSYSKKMSYFLWTRCNYAYYTNTLRNLIGSNHIYRIETIVFQTNCPTPFSCITVIDRYALHLRLHVRCCFVIAVTSLRFWSIFLHPSFLKLGILKWFMRCAPHRLFRLILSYCHILKNNISISISISSRFAIYDTLWSTKLWQ